MSQTLPDEMEDWIEETYEHIYEQYSHAGTELKGGLPIAKALEEAYRKGWDACLLEIAEISVDSKNFQDLCEEVLDLRQKASQRGAQLQVMREWLESRNQMGTNNDWTEFCRERPAAARWFDEDGVPK